MTLDTWFWVWKVIAGSVDSHYHLILNHSYTLPILLKVAGGVHSADHAHARVMAVFNYIHASVDFLLFNTLNCSRNRTPLWFDWLVSFVLLHSDYLWRRFLGAFWDQFLASSLLISQLGEVRAEGIMLALVNTHTLFDATLMWHQVLKILCFWHHFNPCSSPCVFRRIYLWCHKVALLLTHVSLYCHRSTSKLLFFRGDYQFPVCLKWIAPRRHILFLFSPPFFFLPPSWQLQSTIFFSPLYPCYAFSTRAWIRLDWTVLFSLGWAMFALQNLKSCVYCHIVLWCCHVYWPGTQWHHLTDVISCKGLLTWRDQRSAQVFSGMTRLLPNSLLTIHGGHRCQMCFERRAAGVKVRRRGTEDRLWDSDPTEPNLWFLKLQLAFNDWKRK